MQSGTLKGTFTTDGSMPGDGTAAAGVYTISGFTVYESAFPDIETGSIADGTYAFGSQPTYQIDWSGTTVNGFYRLSGTATNGFGITNGPGGAGAYIIFDINYQAADTRASMGTAIFASAITPALTPVPATGLCDNEPPPFGSGESPPDVLQQYARDIDDVCASSWGPSWAQWPNDHTGGWVCTRSLYYNTSTRSWQVR